MKYGQWWNPSGRIWRTSCRRRSCTECRLCSCRTFREEPLGTPVSLRSGALVISLWPNEGSRDPAHLTVLGRGSRLADDARLRLVTSYRESPGVRSPALPVAALRCFFVGGVSLPGGANLPR